jgi:hypothetical protein
MADISLENRTTSGFPVAIGTGLALETLFNPLQPVYDEAREVPDKVDLKDYDVYLFNVSTIARNILGSIPSEDVYKLKKETLLETVLEELEFLSELFTSNGANIKFYKCTYKTAIGKYSSKLRTHVTPKQITVFSLYEYLLDKLKLYDEIVECDTLIDIDKKSTAVILTHTPLDLCSHINYTKLDLLESHTGVIKGRKEFYTKYYPVGTSDMSFLPMSEILLPIFGDSVMFKPDKLNVRLDTLKLLEAKRVDPFTSDGTLKILLNAH